MNFASAFLFGITLGITLYLFYLIFYILKKRKEYQSFKLPEYSQVSIEKINFKSKNGIVWIEKISFGNGRIYLGYKKLDKDHSFPHVCIADKKDGKRVGIALWTVKPKWNQHQLTLKTLETLSLGIMNNLLRKEHPMSDWKLEKIFYLNGWKT